MKAQAILLSITPIGLHAWFHPGAEPVNLPFLYKGALPVVVPPTHRGLTAECLQDAGFSIGWAARASDQSHAQRSFRRWA